jgi:hypothetical protein
MSLSTVEVVAANGWHGPSYLKSPGSGISVPGVVVPGVVVPGVVLVPSALSPSLHWHGAIQTAGASALIHVLMSSTSSVKSAGAQNCLFGINSLPVDQLHPFSREQSVADYWLTQSFHSSSVVYSVTVTGWQKSVLNNGLPIIVVSVAVSFPCLHWHPSLQSATASAERHFLIRVVSLVRSIGAQKS